MEHSDIHRLETLETKVANLERAYNALADRVNAGSIGKPSAGAGADDTMKRIKQFLDKYGDPLDPLPPEDKTVKTADTVDRQPPTGTTS
jgi:hypothetical protein